MSTPTTLPRFDVVKEAFINASAEDVFDSILEQLGPGFEKHDGAPMPLKFEAWPGGRWYRDLENSTGHFWGHVQVIKPPTLLEVTGPMFMSFPVMSHLQYRVTPEGAGCRLTVTHRAVGDIPAEMGAGVTTGWGYIHDRIGQRAVAKAAKH